MVVSAGPELLHPSVVRPKVRAPKTDMWGQTQRRRRKQGSPLNKKWFSGFRELMNIPTDNIEVGVAFGICFKEASSDSDSASLDFFLKPSSLHDPGWSLASRQVMSWSYALQTSDWLGCLCPVLPGTVPPLGVPWAYTIFLTHLLKKLFYDFYL